MGILEKLRPAPRWKHADPSVRAAAVYDIGPEEADALRALAREDADARVRRAAVMRLDEVDVLAEIAGSDPDEDVRGEAVRGLAGIAAEADALGAISQRARNKVAARRARTKLRSLEEPQQPPQDQAAPMSAEDRQRARDLLHRAEGIVTMANAEEASTALADARLAWAEFQ